MIVIENHLQPVRFVRMNLSPINIGRNTVRGIVSNWLIKRPWRAGIILPIRTAVHIISDVGVAVIGTLSGRKFIGGMIISVKIVA